jgi:hypothetical protein
LITSQNKLTGVVEQKYGPIGKAERDALVIVAARPFKQERIHDEMLSVCIIVYEEVVDGSVNIFWEPTYTQF